MYTQNEGDESARNALLYLHSYGVGLDERKII